MADSNPCRFERIVHRRLQLACLDSGTTILEQGGSQDKLPERQSLVLVVSLSS